MRMSGYTNPIRSFERKLAPDFAQREFRDPGLRSSGMHPSGLGSLHHTMPHLQRLSATRLQSGGALDLGLPGYNPDPQFRQYLERRRQQAAQIASPRAFDAFPGSTASFAMAEGGAATLDEAFGPDDQQPTDSAAGDTDDAGGGLEELLESGDDASPQEQHLKQIVSEALLALEGQHPDAKEALAHFVDTFGPQALRDLQQLAEQQHAEQPEEDEENEDTGLPPGQPPPDMEQAGLQLQAAGGGLLNGPGSGQSDEIEGMTPSGRPVLLSDGEYVIDAPTVAALGDGSTDAGARRLDDLRRQIRRDAYGHTGQAKPMKKGGAALVIRLGK